MKVGNKNGRENSDSKTMIIVLSIVIIVLVAIVIKMFYNKYYVDNSKLNNDEGHGTNIINDNEISIEENAFLNNYGIYLDYMFYSIVFITHLYIYCVCCFISNNCCCLLCERWYH